MSRRAPPVAMILAAGRGERMRPLTDTCPKPLLRVRGKPLVVWHLEALARAGVREVVINTAWLEERLVEALGDGARWGVTIHWSLEGRDHGGALETAGGIAKARPWLGECFWIVSGDVYLPGFEFDAAAAGRFAASDRLAHLWLAPNAPHHPRGDFGIDTATGLATRRDGVPRLTWASVGLLRTGLVDDVAVGERAALGPRLFTAADEGRVSADKLATPWTDVGTVERLRALNADFEEDDATADG